MTENQLHLEDGTKNDTRVQQCGSHGKDIEEEGKELFAIHTRDVMDSKVNQGSSCSSERRLCAVLVTIQFMPVQR